MADLGGPNTGGGAWAGLAAFVGSLTAGAALLIKTWLEGRKCSDDELRKAGEAAVEAYERRHRRPAKRARSTAATRRRKDEP